ncbi:MAG: cytochrome c biogenesis heme-transporting ATPase CcmA [Pseudomonadota bacterium]
MLEPAALNAPLIRLRDLELRRGERVLLSELNLDIHPGKLLLIEGANGSGKTSLLRCMAGLSKFGHIGDVERSCNEVLYLGHRPGIKQLLTPRENLAWVCRCQGWDSAGIDGALASVGLVGVEDRLCQQLSAGQQRRVNLARLYLSFAQATPRALWLLDEPFTAIDRDGVSTLASTLSEQVARGGTVVLTSHQDLPLDIPLTRVVLGAAA